VFRLVDARAGFPVNGNVRIYGEGSVQPKEKCER
jgi:hypothetical protein